MLNSGPDLREREVACLDLFGNQLFPREERFIGPAHCGPANNTVDAALIPKHIASPHTPAFLFNLLTSNGTGSDFQK